MTRNRRVVIEVQGEEPDALKRISLLNDAFLRVVTGARLIEVVQADYQAGHMEFVVDDPRVRPQVEGGVSIRYAAAA